MRVLGLDPGLKTTGWAVVERERGHLRAVALGVLETPTTEPAADRLGQLRAGLAAVIAAHSPEAVAAERLFFNVNVRTAISVGQASGALCAAAAEAGLAVSEYTPLEVKQAVTGVGNAPKSQVQAMVRTLLGMTAVPSPPDVADACALAICHLNRTGLAAALARTAQR